MFQILSFVKKANTTFPIFPENYGSVLYWNLPKPFLDALHIAKTCKYVDLLLEVLCACMKDTNQEKVSLKFPKENVAITWLQAK